MGPVINYPDHSPESENYGFAGEGVSRSSTDSETASRFAGQTTSEERGAGENRPGNPVGPHLEEQEAQDDRERRVNDLIQALGLSPNAPGAYSGAPAAEGIQASASSLGASRDSEVGINKDPYGRFEAPSTVAPHVKVHGTEEYHNQVNSAMQKIMQAPSGKKMIDELKKSARKGNTVTIRDGANSAAGARLNDKQQGHYSDLSFGEKNDKAIELAQKKTLGRKGEGANAEVTWNPKQALRLNDQGRPIDANGDPAESHLALAHELVHARRIVKGTSTMGDPKKRYDPSTREGKEELRAVGIGSPKNEKRVSENSIRKELQFPLRSSYKSVTPPPTPPESPISFARSSEPNQPFRSSTINSDE